MKKIIFPLTFLSTLALPLFAFAQTGVVTINPNIPGLYQVSTVGPCGWLVNFYAFALTISGILAFGAVVYGGYLYATSAGNASKQSEGRQWIWSALLGVLLLGGAYLILYTVNPNLTKCSLPALSSVAGPGGSGGNGGNNNPSGNGGNCASGVCQTLPNCTPVAGKTNCGGAQGMVDLLNCINIGDPNYTVNEGYPPIGQHSDPGHNNGCSIDVHATSCAAVQKFISTAWACGSSQVLNEYPQCGGKVFSHTTGGNIHVVARKGDGGC